MPNDPVSPELLRFITRYIHSVEQLEILCLVGSNSNKPWTVVEVLHQIQSSEQSVSDCLRKFQHEGFLEMTPEGRFRFAPKAPEMSNMVQELAKSYRERRVAIVELIYKKPQDAIQDFADAFRFRKDK